MHARPESRCTLRSHTHWIWSAIRPRAVLQSTSRAASTHKLSTRWLVKGSSGLHGFPQLTRSHHRGDSPQNVTRYSRTNAGDVSSSAPQDPLQFFWRRCEGHELLQQTLSNSCRISYQWVGRRFVNRPSSPTCASGLFQPTPRTKPFGSASLSTPTPCARVCSHHLRCPRRKQSQMMISTSGSPHRSLPGPEGNGCIRPS